MFAGMKLPLSIALAVCGAAALVNGVALLEAQLVAGAALLLGAAVTLLPRPGRVDSDRASVRLAVRLARAGEPTLLIERGGRLQVAAARGAHPAALRTVGALEKGTLILARER
jgi:hypothetical protein